MGWRWIVCCSSLVRPWWFSDLCVILTMANQRLTQHLLNISILNAAFMQVWVKEAKWLTYPSCIFFWGGQCDSIIGIKKKGVAFVRAIMTTTSFIKWAKWYYTCRRYCTLHLKYCPHAIHRCSLIINPCTLRHSVYTVYSTWLHNYLETFKHCLVNRPYIALSLKCSPQIFSKI